jgi:hypothetical protein
MSDVKHVAGYREFINFKINYFFCLQLQERSNDPGNFYPGQAIFVGYCLSVYRMVLDSSPLDTVIPDTNFGIWTMLHYFVP